MSSLNVTFLGKAYFLPEDILVYIDLLGFTNSVQAQLMAAFSRKLGQSDSGFITDQDFSDDINQQGKKFIGKLCEHGIFNRTVNDYLKENKGYQLISDVNKEAFSKSIDLLKREMESWKAGYEDAMYKKESSVTGMGFSIWSGSLINHALYAAMQASTLDKQEKAASKQYQKDMDALQAKLDSQFGGEKSKYINNVYFPHMETATMAFAYELLDRYLSDLIANHKFDGEALKYVDIERSNDLLENLSLSANKKAILEGAFMACPFNFAVYQNAMKYELLDYESFQTAKIFNHGDRILAGLKERWGNVSFPTNFYVNYQVVNQWATYVDKTPLELLRTLTEPYVIGVVKAYERIADMLSDSSLCHKIMQECSENAILGGSAICSAKAHEYVDHIVSADVWSQLLYSCGHVDLLDRIKVLIPEDVKIVRKADVDRYFIEQLTSAFERTRLVIIAQIDERKQEELRRAEEQRQAEILKKAEDAKRRKKGNIIAVFFAIIGIIAIAFSSYVFNVIIPAKKYQSAEEFLAAGNTVKAAMAFGSLGEYSDAMERSMLLWDDIAQRETISAGTLHTVGLHLDGTVIATGSNKYEQCNVSDWSNIVAISARSGHTVGLHADGTVIAVGDNRRGQCNVSEWTNIVAVSTGGAHTVGLRADGTVIAVGDNRDGQCNTSDWTSIVAISAGSNHTLGLCADGTVVAVGSNYGLWSERHDQCKVSGWKQIKAISAGSYYSTALRTDGRFLAVGDNEDNQCKPLGKNIVAISAGGSHTAGLRDDGTVVAVGLNWYGQCDVSDWREIVAISADGSHTVGLRADGTVVATGENDDGQCIVHDWENIKLPIK